MLYVSVELLTIRRKIGRVPLYGSNILFMPIFFMAQICFQANILSDEISFPWIFHCAAPDVISVRYQATTDVDQSVRLMHNCTSTNQFQPAAFPWQETVICHWKPFFHVSNSLSSFIRRPTVTQCNTEWPEWSKQSLYNTPVTLMAGQLCDTVLHSVTLCGCY